MRVLDVRQLMPAVVRQRFHLQEAFLGHGVVQLRAGHGMGQRNLNRFGIQFLGEIDRLLDRLARFAGQAR